MTILPDTSILVAALNESHVAHERALLWLQRLRHGEISGVIAAHSLAEIFAVLTRTPLKPPITPALAWQLLEVDVLPYMEVVTLSPEDYVAVLRHLSSLNIGGGPTYDALIAYVAIKRGVDYLLTLNPEHFRRVYPSFASQIMEP